MNKRTLLVLFACQLLFSLSAFSQEIRKLSTRKSFYNQVDCRKGGSNNSTYEISYTFDLKGQEIRLPKGSKIVFSGGKLVNGTLIGNNSRIDSSPEHIFEGVTFGGRWKNEDACPEWFGALGDGRHDDTRNVLSLLNSRLGKHLVFTGKYVLNNNQLEVVQLDSVTIDGGEFICLGAGLHLAGNNVEIKNISLHGRSRSFANSLNYSHAGLSLIGNNNKLENVEVYNINSSGIRVGGKRIDINNVYSHDNQIGLVVTNRTRDIKISNSRFIDNNIVNKSGADGMLFQRTVSGVVVENCRIEDNGEHGVYFQGQNAVFRNNIVSNNTLDGLKFGSYDDGGFVYDDETLDIWVDGSEGITGFNSVMGGKGYGVANVTIEKNLIENNRGGDAVYFQPSVTNVRIAENEIHNNDITCSFFNYKGSKARLEDINHVVVLANKLIGNSLKDGDLSRIYISATSNVRIADNQCGRIGVYAPNQTTPPKYTSYLKECVIEGNTCQSISINRADSILIRCNEMQWLSTNTNCSRLNVVNNKMTAQDKPVVFNVINDFSMNDVVISCEQLCYETATYKPVAPQVFDNNIINGISSSAGIIRFYGTSGRNSSFKGNKISCQNSESPLLISSEKPIDVDDNVVLGKATGKKATIILTGSGINSRRNESNGRIDTARGVANKSNVSKSLINSKIEEYMGVQ